jgi:hypothetical protein
MKMTITFFFWFESFGLFLPYAVYSANMILFSVFLILASLDNQRQAKYKFLLKIAGIINIITTVLIFFFPTGYSRTSSLTPEEQTLLYGLFYITPALITYIPRIFSFGVVFFIFGFKNRESNHNLLMYSGIMWLIYTFWASICLYSPLGNIPQLAYILLGSDLFYDSYLLNILINVFGVGNLLNLLGTAFLLIHGFSKNDKNLKIGGFIYLLGNVAVSLSIIPYYIGMLFS